MKILTIKPNILTGEIRVPPSKSMAHRAIICAFLSDGTSRIENIELSNDIIATCSAVDALGADIDILDGEITGRKTLIIRGYGSVTVRRSRINCGESGTTSRFLIPITRLIPDTITMDGEGKLVERPFDVFFPIFQDQGITYETNAGKLPMVLKGKLKPGKYRVRGDVSSQFISGLLLALPLLPGNSSIDVTTPLESSGYIDMTMEIQKRFGIEIKYDCKKNHFEIPGWQKYIPQNYKVEGDWSQAAFWLAAGALAGPVEITGLNRNSTQGDKVIEKFLQSMGAKLNWKGSRIIVSRGVIGGIEMDVSQCPDLVPILAVLGSLGEDRTVICNAGRLRLKESDRLKAIATELKALGACIEEREESLVINGKEELLGGRIYGWNDHRIVMSAAIAAVSCKKNVTIEGCEAVNKSYPSFWEHYEGIGGKIL